MDQMESVGATNAFEYFDNPVVAAAHQRRESSVGHAPTRPLAEKVTRLLELIKGRMRQRQARGGSGRYSDTRSDGGSIASYASSGTAANTVATGYS